MSLTTYFFSFYNCFPNSFFYFSFSFCNKAYVFARGHHSKSCEIVALNTLKSGFEPKKLYYSSLSKKRAPAVIINLEASIVS